MAGDVVRDYVLRIVVSVLLILVTMKLFPMVQSSVDEAAANATGTVAGILPLVPFMVIVGVIVATFLLIVSGFEREGEEPPSIRLRR